MRKPNILCREGPGEFESLIEITGERNQWNIASAYCTHEEIPCSTNTKKSSYKFEELVDKPVINIERSTPATLHATPKELDATACITTHKKGKDVHHNSHTVHFECTISQTVGTYIQNTSPCCYNETCAICNDCSVDINKCVVCRYSRGITHS